jgi:hypothetical protein
MVQQFMYKVELQVELPAYHLPYKSRWQREGNCPPSKIHGRGIVRRKKITGGEMSGL